MVNNEAKSISHESERDAYTRRWGLTQVVPEERLFLPLRIRVPGNAMKDNALLLP